MKSAILSIAFLAASICMGQTTTLTIPATGGATSAFRAPNGTTQHTSLRAHYIIPASELTALPSGVDITSVAFKLISGTNATANGTLKFYMENVPATTTTNTKSTTWATAITGMDTVYSGPYTVPNTTGAATSSFTLSDTFNYTGAGIFIAYEYVGTNFGTTSAVYDCNNTIASAVRIIFDTTSAPGAILSGISSWRPIFDVVYVNPFTNDMVVDNLTLEIGHHNKLNDTSQSITGIVRNNSSVALTSVPVTLTITGANPSTSTQTIASIAAAASDTLTFTNISTIMSGLQTVKLSVPADQFTANDSIQLRQSVSCDTLSYSDNSAPYTAIGFNTGSGILASKHTNSSTVNISIKSIYANIDQSTNITGNQLQAVVVDTGGNIIDSSAIVIISSTQLGTRLIFQLTGNNIITPTNPDYFIGIRQYPDSIVGYFPLSSHSPSTVPSDRYYSFDLDGSAQSTSYTTLGTLGLGAIMEVEKITLTNSDVNDTICSGEGIVFTASGTSAPLYNFKSGTTSVQNSASTTYSTNLSASASISVEGEYKSCPILSNVNSINVVTIDTSGSKTNDSTVMSNTTWATYQWIDCGTDTAISGATSQTFVASVSGNYKVIISKNGCSDTSNCFSLIVPVASINENGIETLKIYPSPTANILFVEVSQTVFTTVSIMDVNGKVVFSSNAKQSKLQFDLSGLSSGVYFVNVETENGKEVKRIIKN